MLSASLLTLCCPPVAAEKYICHMLEVTFNSLFYIALREETHLAAHRTYFLGYTQIISNFSLITQTLVSYLCPKLFKIIY